MKNYCTREHQMSGSPTESVLAVLGLLLIWPSTWRPSTLDMRQSHPVNDSTRMAELAYTYRYVSLFVVIILLVLL